jgi:Glycosyl transferase family 2
VNLAPIILFVYNRPSHTKQTIEALKYNELAQDSNLFIYSDAPKNEENQLNVEKVREYIKTVDGFKKVTIIERKNNWGLANSIIDGVTRIVNEYGKIIVLEDDLITSKFFLKYMNESLEKYEHESKVYSVTGYSFSSEIADIDSTYFLKLTSSWSWGTWKDKWKNFSHKVSVFDYCLEDKYKFNYDGSYDFTELVDKQLNNKIDSWAIFWYASVFKQNGLTLYPSISLVKNIGFDGSGTHCGLSFIGKNHSHDYDYVLVNNINEKIMNREYISSILKNKKQQRKIVAEIINKIKRVFI